MTNEYRKHPDHGHDHDEDCADQPHPPGTESACEPLPLSTPPTLKEPEKCPDPPTSCNCPPKPGVNTNCLQELIDKQAADILAADKAKAFKTELEKVLDNAKKASQAYTRDKYTALLAEWQRQDKVIVDLLRSLECAVPCWSCILDCYVSPLLNEFYYAKKYLYNDGQLYNEVHTLYDLQYWHLRNKAAKQRTYDRIASVMAAWSDPAKTIEATLNANKGLIDSVSKVIGQTAGQALYDVIVILVQRHLLIAPPASPETMTKIDKKFTKFYECDPGELDDCCGPDVGEWSLRRQLVGGALPYLIRPDDYFILICCLVEQRYGPAKDALSKAETDLAAVTDQITRYELQFKNGWVNSFATAAKAAIPSVIDCQDHDCDEETQQAKSSRGY